MRHRNAQPGAGLDVDVRADRAGLRTQAQPRQLLEQLARQLGAIAAVVIKRAAAKARNEAELYLLIADEIQDPVEKKVYVRMCVCAQWATYADPISRTTPGHFCEKCFSSAHYSAETKQVVDFRCFRYFHDELQG